MKISDYAVICRRETLDLSIAVLGLVNEGYQPLGGSYATALGFH